MFKLLVSRGNVFFMCISVILISIFLSSCNSSQKEPQVESQNPEFQKIETSINDFNSTNAVLLNAFDDYKGITNSIIEAQKDSKIDKKEYGQLRTLASNRFIAYYVAFCNKTFKTTQWPTEDLSAMNEISSYLAENLNKSLLKKNKESLSKINSILSSCNTAIEYTQKTKFISISQTRNTISEVKEILANAELRNNQPLMKQLASLPLEIEKSHSEYIMQQINKLDASNTRDRSYFDQESNKIQNAINLYNSEAKALYGNNRYYPQLMGAYRSLVNKYSHLTL